MGSGGTKIQSLNVSIKRKDGKMPLSVKFCGYMGSLLITCYLIYFAYFAYTVFDEINTQQTAAFGGATTSGHFHRDESYFELKNERHVTPGKDFAIDTANITQLEEYRAFNPAVHFYKGSTFMIIRNGKPEWRKNNTLVIGTLIKEFNDHDELVGMNFHKINDLDPFPDAFDCEMDPDYIDGGHGIQDPRLFEHHNKFYILFNARRQHAAPFIACDDRLPQRGIYLAHITIMDKTLKLTHTRLLNYSGSTRVERNWLPIEDKHRMLFVYSFFPTMHILELPSKDSSEVVPFQQIQTSDSLDNVFADIANEANTTMSEAKRRIAIHGSSPILLVKNVLLGIVHCHFENQEGHRTYLNYFFKCDPVSFKIIDSAKKHLPLTSDIDEKFTLLNKQKWYYEANYPMGNRISFVSDMSISKSELIIAYGAGDAESRTFIVKVRDVEHYFSD